MAGQLKLYNYLVKLRPELALVYESLQRRTGGFQLTVVDGIEHPFGFWVATMWSGIRMSELCLYMNGPITDEHYARLVGGTDVSALESFFLTAPGCPLVTVLTDVPMTARERKAYQQRRCVEVSLCDDGRSVRIGSRTISLSVSLPPLPFFWRMAWLATVAATQCMNAPVLCHVTG